MKVYPIQFSIRTLFMGTLSLDSYHLSQCVWKEEDGERKGRREQRIKAGETGREGDRDTTTISSVVFLVIKTLTLLDQSSSLVASCS